MASRLRVLAAQGLARSGNESIWELEVRGDQERAQLLAENLPTTPPNYANASLKLLEDRLVEVHKLTKEAEGIAATYDDSVAADVRYTEQRRADINRIGVR